MQEGITGKVMLQGEIVNRKKQVWKPYFKGGNIRSCKRKNHSKYFRPHNFYPQSSRNLGNKSYFATQKELSVLELEILDTT